jgi:hypothetical protein
MNQSLTHEKSLKNSLIGIIPDGLTKDLVIKRMMRCTIYLTKDQGCGMRTGAANHLKTVKSCLKKLDRLCILGPIRLDFREKMGKMGKFVLHMWYPHSFGKIFIEVRLYGQFKVLNPRGARSWARQVFGVFFVKYTERLCDRFLKPSVQS